MPVIEIDDLRLRYGDTVALDGAGFAVERGEIFGLLGPNGAGKSSIVACLTGLRRPDGGRVAVLDLDPSRDRAVLRRAVGVQLQDSQLPYRLRVGEILRLYRSFYDRGADPDALLRGLGLDAKRDTAFEDLSGGQQQRLAIALALVGDPEIAILDELTTGLDPRARREAWELIAGIRDRGVTVLLVTHLMEEAERLCDRVALLDAGRVVAVDTPAGLARSVDGASRVRFRTDEPLDLRVLAELPEVGAVTEDRGAVVVSGSEDVLVAVVTALAARGVRPRELAMERTSLEDAVVALTGGAR